MKITCNIDNHNRQPKQMKRARDIRDQVVGLMDRVDLMLVSNDDNTDSVPIRKALTSGFFFNAARIQMNGEAYRTIKQSQSVMIHPSSSLFQVNPPVVIFYELVLTTKEYMRQVLEINPEWLIEVAPHYYREKDIEETIVKKKKMPILKKQ